MGEQLTTEQLEKIRIRKLLKFGCLPAAIFLIVVFIVLAFIKQNNKPVTHSNNEATAFADDSRNKVESSIEPAKFNDPLNIGVDSVKALIGNTVPYDKWEIWGQPETLEGTNNQYWVVYLSKANISFVSDKTTDSVLYAGFDENSAINYTKETKTRREELSKKSFSALEIDEKHDESEKVLSEVKSLYTELMGFKSKKDFKEYGFMIDGPYNSWLKRVKELKDNHDPEILIDKRIFIGDLEQLGFAYVGSKGKETTVTETFNKSFANAFSFKPAETTVASSGKNNYDKVKREYQLLGKWTITNSILKANGLQSAYKYEIYRNGTKYIGVIPQEDRKYQTETLEKIGNNYFIKGNNVNNENGEYYQIDAQLNMTLFDRDGDLSTAGYKAIRDH